MVILGTGTMDKLPVEIDFGRARKIKRQWARFIYSFRITVNVRWTVFGQNKFDCQTISVVEITSTLVSRYMRRHMMMRHLGPRRYTNVFDESKINRIRWIAMFWTEYNDSLAHSVNRMCEWIVLNTANHACILLLVTIPRIESSHFSASTTHLR